MDVLGIQNRLVAAGFSPGKVDGDIGPNTYTAIINYAAKKDLGALSVLLGRAMASDFPKYGIVTPLRIAHFIAQACHETGGFHYLSELGSGKDTNHDGYDDYLQHYDFRKDLGDSHVGDGDKYRGRGLFQITGIFNYTVYGTRIGVNLLANPAQAAQPEIATLTACLFWSDRKLNNYADADDVTTITKKINGGLNGLVDRQTITYRMKVLLGA
jgi:putative chitinase